jgi:hypothetical protein
MNYYDTRSAPRAAYDKALAFEICDRYGNGEMLGEILAQPGMPEAATFFRWVDEHPELDQQFHATGELRKMLAEQNYALGLMEKEKRSQAKYRARAWEEMYSLIGEPPVLSTENEDAHAQLLTVFTERLQPQDIIAQLLVKQAVDATWEEKRFAREKAQLPERAYHEELETRAQTQAHAQEPGKETDCMVTKSATALDHSRGLENKFPYYQALDRVQMQAARRRAHALRELERWNKGLGREARELSDRSVWGEAICPAKPPAQDPAPLASTGEERR